MHGLYAIVSNNWLITVCLSYNLEFVAHEDTFELFKSLDINNNDNIEPNEIDDSLEGMNISLKKI